MKSRFCVLALAAGLFACGDNIDEGSTEFVITTMAGDGGTMEEGRTVEAGSSGHTFAVTPNRLFAADAVEGCGGTLSGDTFTTGTIDADCTITASFATAIALEVSPLFPQNGADWNDYVLGIDVASATDTACDPDTDLACLHAGERLVVEVSGETTDCSGLEARDELGAFRWVCDDSSGTARFTSFNLAADKGLTDLIDFANLTFLANSVTVSADGNDVTSSPSEAWWTNPVVESNAGGSLIAASTVHVVTADVNADYTLDADGVVLVVEPGSTVTAVDSAIGSTGFDHLWIEGAVAGGTNGVRLVQARFSVVRRLIVNNASDDGLVVVDCFDSRFSLIEATNNSGNGIFVREDGGVGAGGNRLFRVTASNNDGRGINMLNASHDHISEVTVTNNALNGVLQLNGPNNTFAAVTAAGNISGLANAGAAAKVFAVTTANNSDSGVALATSDGIAAAIASTNSGTGFDHLSGSNNVFSDLTSSDNDIGISLASTLALATRFTGILQIGNNGTDDCTLSNGEEPGLDGACANTGLSDAALTTGVSLAASFTAKVAADDEVNADDTDGAATFPVDPTSFDWTRFANRFRGWGLDGSAFPNADQRGRWTAGAGRIWDWSTVATDANLLDKLALPTGDTTFTARWFGTPATNDDVGCDALIPGSTFNATDTVCQSVMLRNSFELADDGVGNDNNLCESGERCLYTPNIGSYQGHGALVSAGAFTDGAITGVELLRFENNGR